MVPLIVVNLLDLEHVGVFTNAVENFRNYIQARSASKWVWSDAFGSLTRSRVVLGLRAFGTKKSLTALSAHTIQILRS
jgi:hypothetical protein